MLDLIAMSTLLVLFIIGIFVSILIYCCCVVSSESTPIEEKNECEMKAIKEYQRRKDIKNGTNK